MTILLLADHANTTLGGATAKALTAANAMGGDIHILVAGHNCAPAAAEAAKLAGVAKVLVADAPHYEHGLAEEVAALVVSLMPSYSAAVTGGTTTGKNIFPRVAALLDVMQISDIIAVKGPTTFERPIYAGNALQTVESTDAKLVVTIRSAAFAAAPTGGSAPIETVGWPAPLGLSSFKSAEFTKSDRPELTAAKICDLWMSVQSESLGPAIQLKPGYETFWAYIPHFVHSPFYVYAYAFGDCLVNSLYAVYEKSASGFAERYLEMLSAGGTKHHSELLAPFGLDARDPKFWDGGLSVIAGLIDELEALE